MRQLRKINNNIIDYNIKNNKTVLNIMIKSNNRKYIKRLSNIRLRK